MKCLQTDLFKVGVQVFEDLGFLLPSAELNKEQAGAELQSAVTVEFSGPVKGMILLTLSGPILPVLTANMLGEEEPTTESQELDALREVANVICGNLLPSLVKQDAVFDISAPQVRELQYLESQELKKTSIFQTIGLENGRADIRLYLPEDYLVQEA